jgi:soluble lytic murein transglycosylase
VTHNPIRSLTRRWLAGLLLVLPFAVTPAATDEPATARRNFLAAEAALAAGAFGRAEVLASTLGDYPLRVDLEAALFQTQLETTAPASLTDWLAEHAGLLPAEAVRSRWLRQLALSGQWQSYADHYLPQTDIALRCAHLNARLEIGRPAGVAAEAAELWVTGRSLPPDCDAVFRYLETQPEFTPELHWRRLEAALAKKNLDFAAWLVRRYPKLNAPWAERLLRARRDPGAALDALADTATDPRASAVRLEAYRSWASKSAEAAAAHFDRRLAGREPGPADEAIMATLARALSAARSPAAANWFDRLPAAAQDAPLQEAMLRTALATSDWRRLEVWTRGEAAIDMEPLRWRYFRARALEQLGDQTAAEAIYRGLVGGTDYYSLRAADRLGLPYRFENHRHQLPAQELEHLEAEAGPRRAREFLALGRADNARREWQHWLKTLLPHQIAHAAVMAHRWNWHDRALLTAAKARDLNDVEVRFPLPFRAAIDARASASGLPPGLIYSVVRSESAFQADAGSPVGALGLMQLMPATGRETAAKLGLKLKAVTALFEPELNLELGSSYLARMLGRYEQNVAMAAAAYNAGPGRVAAWRPATGCADAELWIEAIPFAETHRYVRRVLAYNVVYAWRLGATPPPLATHAPPQPRPRPVGERLRPKACG